MSKSKSAKKVLVQNLSNRGFYVAKDVFLKRAAEQPSPVLMEEVHAVKLAKLFPKEVILIGSNGKRIAVDSIAPSVEAVGESSEAEEFEKGSEESK